MRSTKLALLSGIALLAALAPASLSARPGWGGPGWGNSPGGLDNWADSRWDHPRAGRQGRDDREGKIEVASFAAKGDAVQALGHGAVTVELAADNGPPGDADAAYEAAVIDQLVKAGYDTTAASANGQVAELRIVRKEIEPPEAKHKPVSGEMDMGISNRGSMLGMALNIDLSKPKKALVSTRLEARIRDKASGAVLWEGRADIATRDGDDDWPNQTIATKLAGSLFKRFPGTTDETYRAE